MTGHVCCEKCQYPLFIVDDGLYKCYKCGRFYEVIIKEKKEDD